MSAAAVIDDEVEAFRAEARAWLEKNFPPSLKGRVGMMLPDSGRPSSDDFNRWKKAMARKAGARPPGPSSMAAAV